MRKKRKRQLPSLFKIGERPIGIEYKIRSGRYDDLLMKIKALEATGSVHISPSMFEKSGLTPGGIKSKCRRAGLGEIAVVEHEGLIHIFPIRRMEEE